MAISGLKGPGAAPVRDGSGLRIGIVHARWNLSIITPLLEGTKATLLSAGVLESNIEIQTVPGSFELPLAVRGLYSASQVQATAAGTTSIGAGDLLGSSTTDLTALQAKEEAKTTAHQPFDAIIAIGILIKGETMHFEYIADAVSHGLMRVQLDNGVPLVFGVLTVLDEDQAKIRAGIGGTSGKEGHNHGEDWGHAAVEMGLKRRQWAAGEIV